VNLKQIRNQIDAIDTELVQLLEQRMTLVCQIAEYKKVAGKAVLDMERERKVLEKAASAVKNKDFEETIIATFSDMMKHSRNYQDEKIGS
jgi:chorismate mutase